MLFSTALTVARINIFLLKFIAFLVLDVLKNQFHFNLSQDIFVDFFCSTSVDIVVKHLT